jgi:hypothetical protein
MRAVDGVGLVCLVLSAAAFACGASALARTEDLTALYWLAMAVVLLRGGVAFARRGAKS